MGRKKRTKITSEKVLILGVDAKRHIYFDAERGVFEAALPDYVLQTFPYSFSLGAKTIEELRENWNERVEEYRKLVASERKIILIGIECECTKEDGKPPEPKTEGRPYAWGGEAMDWNASLKMSFVVGLEVTEGEQKHYRDIYGNDFTRGRNFHDRDGRVIDWTQEREDLLRILVKEVERLGKRVKDAFGDDESEHFDLAAALDKAAGKNLLAYNGREGK